MIEVIAIDLDLTLVNTSRLEPYRDNRDWQGALANLHQTYLYSGVSHFFSEVATFNIPIVVVSNSPSNYVRALLDHHQLKPDMVIGYHDMKSPKPSPDWFRLVKNQYDCYEDNVAFIGNEDTDVFAAQNAGVDFYGVKWGTYSSEVNLIDFKNLLEKIFAFTASKNYRLQQERDLYFCGYYHSGSDDFADRSVRSHLLNYKDGIPNTLDIWSHLMPVIAPSLPPVDLIVRALGHAECTAKSSARDKIWSTLAEHLHGEYLPNALRKTRSTRKSTSMRRHERFKEAQNTYEVAQPNAITKACSILVVDDVYTTGATVQEIKRALLQVNPQANIYAFSLLRTNSGIETNIREATINNTQLLALMNRCRHVSLPPDKSVVETKEPGHASIGEPALNRTPHYIESATQNQSHQKRMTASYTGHGSNFVLHNLPRHSQKSADSRYVTVAKILKNILLRGTPSSPSKFLAKTLGDHIFLPAGAMLSTRRRSWATFEGDQSNWTDQNKAVFTLIFSRLPEDLIFGKKLQSLFLPFVTTADVFSDISAVVANTTLDLVFPEANLVVQVREELSVYDHHLHNVLQARNYEVVYFTPTSIFTKDEIYQERIDHIRNYLSWLEHSESVLSTTGGAHPVPFADWIIEQDILEDSIITSWTYQEVIQIQTTILECVILGLVDPMEGIVIPIQGCRTPNSAQLAVDDLNLWFHHLCILHDLSFDKSIAIDTITKFSAHNESCLKLDIDILASGTDTLSDGSSNIYIRRDPFSKALFCFTNHGQNGVRAKLRDYFELEVSQPVTYSFNYYTIESYRDSLEFILQNVFFPKQDDVHFRDGQLGIIMNCLRRKNTIGLLPTGSGKSVCYQLSALLQPAISFVVCPIKSLMYDQKADLDNIGITRTDYITGDMGKKDKDRVQQSFSQGRYFFILISPERFQQTAFREELEQIGLHRSFAYAVIDEVHCLSEWGHDFRTSYLNLSRTIERFAQQTTYIGLTATASVNVLSDIQKEFSVPDEAIKTPPHFGREELVFNVIDDQNDKFSSLLEHLDQLNRQFGYLDPNQDHCGIIFTSTVSGNRGCAQLAENLSNSLHQPVKFYSGSKPKHWDRSQNFEAYKQQVQKDFKENKFRLLTATKAFGMGINKANISYTIHYGIPASMEALYQEAGRAGRDKIRYLEHPAQCNVLLGVDRNIQQLDAFWNPDTSIPELRSTQKRCSRESDLNISMFLFLKGIMEVKREYELIRAIYDIIVTSDTSSKLTISRAIILSSNVTNPNLEVSNVEKAIFRLSQLGVVKDWTVTNFFTGIYELEIGDTCAIHMAKHLEASIQKYEADFTVAALETSTSDKIIFLRERRNFKPHFGEVGFYITVLLSWSLDHFAYSRRQSLKTVYEQCYAVSSGQITSEQLKQALESYFQFNESSDLLKLIADDPENIEQCFQVFYCPSKNAQSQALLDNDELLLIREQLSRFLESYKNNPGLDLISGLLRLKFNDFNDVDGERRYHAALKKIINYSSERQAEIIGQISAIFRKESSDQQEALVNSTAHIIGDTNLLNIFNETLTEGIADVAILNKQHRRLMEIMKQIGRVKVSY